MKHVSNNFKNVEANSLHVTMLKVTFTVFASFGGFGCYKINSNLTDLQIFGHFYFN